MSFVFVKYLTGFSHYVNVLELHWWTFMAIFIMLCVIGIAWFYIMRIVRLHIVRIIWLYIVRITWLYIIKIVVLCMQLTSIFINLYIDMISFPFALRRKTIHSRQMRIMILPQRLLGWIINNNNITLIPRGFRHNILILFGWFCLLRNVIWLFIERNKLLLGYFWILLN